ncbi:MAG: hypothetical protein IPM03_08245 [Sulfuritalea sp.]|nr:hypothetical protein [Sulfuritalea sp.]
MKLARTNTSPLGEPGFEYHQQLWGDMIYGTREQLQSIGIAVGMAFPGESGGPKRQMTVTAAWISDDDKRFLRGHLQRVYSIPWPGPEEAVD